MSRVRTEVEAEVCDVFYVRIMGKTRGHFPVLPDDEGTVLSFMEWMNEEKVFPKHTMFSGGGGWSGIFWTKDKERVSAWLDANNKLSTYELVPE